MSRPLALLLVALAGVLACTGSEPPAYVQTLTLRGTPYQRGLQHGQALGPRIRSLYTTLLSNSLLPYLNREQADVASVLQRYREDPDDGVTSYVEGWKQACRAACTADCAERCGFSYLLMLDSAATLKAYIPEPYLDEMQGIADGAGLPFEKILILNTFYDTLLSFRAITAFIKQIQAPRLEALAFVGGVPTDGRDNDGDGDTDEADEGTQAPFEPAPWASMVEVPPAARVELLLHDTKLGIGVDKGDTPGVDPATVRVECDGQAFEYPRDEGALQIRPVDGDPERLWVSFAPPDGFPAASVVSLLVMAGDHNRIVEPPPLHARFMRDERVTFSTAGYGLPAEAIPNRGQPDGRSQPPAHAFALTGAATLDGAPLVAQHYSLLDANTVHKHAVVFLHVPDQGSPFAILGYAGLVWGFSGMNAHGLTAAFTQSDTLNNTMAGEFFRDLFDARLVSTGVPMGIVARDLLAERSGVAESLDLLPRVPATFGWSLLLADPSGDLAVAEVDGDILGTPSGGLHVRRAGTPPAGTRAPAPAGTERLLAASHFQDDLDEIRTSILVFDVKPQRYWSSFYYRSVSALYTLADALDAAGPLDVAGAVSVLRTPALVDTRDSMWAAVYRPAERTLWYAAGVMPATDAPFVPIDLRELQGGAP